MATWEHALALFAQAAEPLALRWMLVGSGATRLHGVTGVEPGDVDILIHPDTDDGPLHDLARRLCAVVEPSHGGGDDLATFVSSAERPLIDSGAWTFGRWYVDGFKVEVSRIREDVGDLVHETQGRAAWSHGVVVPWQGLRIPLVPLEIQWATMLVRGQVERLDAIRATPPTAWDDDLARAAIVARHLDPEHVPASPT